MSHHLDLSRLLDLTKIYVDQSFVSRDIDLPWFFGELDGCLFKFTPALADANNVTFLDIWCEEQPRDAVSTLVGAQAAVPDATLESESTEIVVRLYKPWSETDTIIQGLEGANFTFKSGDILTMATRIDEYGKPNLRCSLDPV